MEAASFNCIPMHNQVITLGEWGWIAGSKSLNSEQFLKALRDLEFEGIATRWINNEAMQLCTSFGKDVFEPDTPEINTIHNPVLFKYYMNGSWDLY